MKKTKEEILDIIKEHVTYARSKFDVVEFSPEDATRTELDYLLEVVQTAVDAGATYINIPDTVGFTTPEEFGNIFKYLIENVTSDHEIIFSPHCHDDLGMEEQKQLEKDGSPQEIGSFNRFPDIIMMDGGRGQVNICLQVLSELGLDIPVCGMVKDDFHRTRGLYYNNVEIPIDRHGEGFKLITRIQDEAHRFAIEFHRSLRSKSQVHSVLDDIEGIGPARRKALMRRYQSLEKIKEADVDDLMQTETMNEKAAQAVYAFFHSAT